MYIMLCAYIFRMACRCFWDSDTDSYAQDIYISVSYVWIVSESNVAPFILTIVIFWLTYVNNRY